MARLRILRFCAVAGFILLWLGCGPNPAERSGPDPAATTLSSHSAAAVQWEEGWAQAFARARSEDKVVLVTFYADWCVWCKRLESTTFRDEKVASALASRVVPLRLDVEGQGRQASSDLGVATLPTTLILDSDGTERGRIDGYLPPAEFLARLGALVGHEG